MNERNADQRDPDHRAGGDRRDRRHRLDCRVYDAGMDRRLLGNVDSEESCGLRRDKTIR